MSENRDYYLQQLGIIRYQQRQARSSASQAQWQDLAHRVKNCQACPLAKSRTQTVFGVGDHQADLVVVGEAPGYHEDQQGEPFVGRAGQLLDEILRAVGLGREQIYIANVLKCRPPNNRDPQMEEVTQCTPYLKHQLELLAPKLIVAVGRHAAHFLLDSNQSLAKLRGQQHRYHDIPLIVSYHPAYLLRKPGDKAKALQDWWLVAKTLNLFAEQ